MKLVKATVAMCRICGKPVEREDVPMYPMFICPDGHAEPKYDLGVYVPDTAVEREQQPKAVCGGCAVCNKHKELVACHSCYQQGCSGPVG